MTPSGAGATFRPSTVKIVVCAKQVIDPETPLSAFRIDPDLMKVAAAPGVPPVVNGFDENATEAALRIKDASGASVAVLSVGDGFAMDVIKKPVSMGADDLVLVQAPELADLDAFATAYVLSRAVEALGADLILCGRQASDWDNAQVPLILAEMLDVACLPFAQDVTVDGGTVRAERVLAAGYEEIEADLPAVVTVSNELGPPRYPTLRGIMAAGRKQATVMSPSDLGLDAARLAPRCEMEELYVPESSRLCEFIEGESGADSGRLLALRLREEGLI